MRKIFMFCLTGALALATTSCKDEKVTTMQTITVNGQICEVKSAFSPLNVLDRNGQQTDKKLQINDLWLFLLPESPASKTSKVR